MGCQCCLCCLQCETFVLASSHHVFGTSLMSEQALCVPLQFLDSYKSVTLQSMAQSFGVSVDFIDSELADFIVAGRLTAKIDKVAGVVETNRWVIPHCWPALLCFGFMSWPHIHLTCISILSQ